MKTLMVQMKTKEQLLNIPMTYMDKSGDIWEASIKYEAWAIGGSPDSDGEVLCIFADDFGKIINFYEEYGLYADTDLDKVKWGIDRILPKEEYTEYYL